MGLVFMFCGRYLVINQQVFEAGRVWIDAGQLRIDLGLNRV